MVIRCNWYGITYYTRANEVSGSPDSSRPGDEAEPEPAPEGLRERKKRLTREAIFAAADRMFAARGFENVTVAEIADAANVSVKTLFTYVSAKEELLFGGQPTVLDAVVRAVANRRLGQTPLVAAAQALLAAVGERDEKLSLEAFQRMISSGPAARSLARARWEETETQLAGVLLGGGARRPGRRPGRAGRPPADRGADHGARPHRHQRGGGRPDHQVGRHRRGPP